jgi:hypothetical protein
MWIPLCGCLCIFSFVLLSGQKLVLDMTYLVGGSSKSAEVSVSIIAMMWMFSAVTK